jgi:hypothetical protein
MLLTALGQLRGTFVTATYVNFVPNDSALALTDSERPALVVEGDEQSQASTIPCRYLLCCNYCSADPLTSPVFLECLPTVNLTKHANTNDSYPITNSFNRQESKPQYVSNSAADTSYYSYSTFAFYLGRQNATGRLKYKVTHADSSFAESVDRLTETCQWTPPPTVMARSGILQLHRNGHLDREKLSNITSIASKYPASTSGCS